MSDSLISDLLNKPDAAPKITDAQRVASAFAQAMGWLIFAAVTTKVPALVAVVYLFRVSVKAAALLGLMTVPFWCLAFAGAIGLILKRTWGFYLVYAFTAVSLFGIGVPFLAGFSFFPLLERILHLGPLQSLLHLGCNLSLTLALMWAHRQLSRADAWLRRPRLVLTAGVIGVLLFAAGLWRNRFHYVNRAVPAASALPVVGHVFAGFETRGPVEVCSIEHPALDGLITVFSGVAEGEQVKQLATRLRLTDIDREEGWKKMLPVLKSWRLNETRVPRDFGADALHYSGRVPGHRKLQFQLCWRPGDDRFCGQLFGKVGTPGTAQPERASPPEDAPELPRPAPSPRSP